MARLPPKDLATRKPRIAVLAAGYRLWRSHECDLGPVYFGKKAAYRFDDPLRQFGVLYLGYNLNGAFMESDGRRSLRTRVVSEHLLRSRCYSEINVKRRLRLIDLTGPGLARISAEASLTTSPSYAKSQQWSRALHEDPVLADGLLYRCRHDPSVKALVLFEDRADGDVTAVGPPIGWLDAPGVLGAILDRYDLGLG